MMIEILVLNVVLAQTPGSYAPPDLNGVYEKITEQDRLDRERERRQRLDDNKAQRLREEWLSQWIVQNRNIDPQTVYNQRYMLESLSTKEVLNIEKEMNRRKRLYASQLAKRNRAIRERYRPRQYFYWRWSPYYGFQWRSGYYYPGGYW
jgi:hypothetical protein